uniref:Reticulocalbin-3 n=1 Tax=Strongyloides stercoralis TaxID=6248 RepID=A0A0K0E8B2_STRER
MIIISNTLSIFLILTLYSSTLLVLCDKEHPKHGSYSESKVKDAKHDPHAVHETILGSKKEAQEFDELSEEESKKRLNVLAKKMDINGDGVVTIDELTDWIHHSMIKLDNAEAEERFKEIDVNKDGFITWEEYSKEAFGAEGGITGEGITDPDDKKLFEEDRSYFHAADLNNDAKIVLSEFYAFQAPEHHSHMHDVLIKHTLTDKDLNKDGKISFEEFMHDTHGSSDSEWYKVEKDRFEKEYDKNGDGVLDGDEIRKWLIPDLKETAKSEAEHLIDKADINKNLELTYQEIVDAHQTFVGSEATNYGEILKEIRHEEL